jgi:hypothetical protein
MLGVVEIAAYQTRTETLGPVMVSVDENRVVRAFAAERQLTVSDVVRYALAAYIANATRHRRPARNGGR